MLNFRAVKIYLRNYVAGIRGNYHESSDCSEIPEKIPKFLNQATQRNTSQIFQPKNIPKYKICIPKILQSSLSLEIWSTTPMSGVPPLWEPRSCNHTHGTVCSVMTIGYQ